jgi:energy-coupling factor transport system permease protein
MILVATVENGLYQPAETHLHRLDPRLKAMFCLLLVMIAFAATVWLQLLILIVALLLALWQAPLLISTIWRVSWMLRWLLFFTFLMHLLMSTGRTLWGTEWLSLDGFLLGGFVCVQMLLALIVSALLAITTTKEALCQTFGWFVQPLNWLGCRTEEWQKILLLTIDFVPLVQEEMRAIGKTAAPAEPLVVNRPSVWCAWAEKLQDFLSRLVSQGDSIAYRIATKEETLDLPVALPSLFPLSFHDQLFFVIVSLVAVCCWIVG